MIPQVVGLIARLARTCVPATRTGDYHGGILFSPASHKHTKPRQYDQIGTVVVREFKLEQ